MKPAANAIVCMDTPFGMGQTNAPYAVKQYMNGYGVHYYYWHAWGITELQDALDMVDKINKKHETQRNNRISKSIRIATISR